MDQIIIKNEKVIQSPDREVWLSFKDKKDAKQFLFWWEIEGEQIFRDWDQEFPH